MFTPKQDTALTLDSQVECRENQYSVGGMFQIRLSSSFDVHELDQIESGIEQAGQENLCRYFWVKPHGV